MRILLIHQYYLEEGDPGGSRFNEMTQVWAERGHQVTVVCGMLNYLTGKIPEKYNGFRKHESIYYNGVRVIRAKVGSGYNASFFKRLLNLFSFVYYGLLAVRKESDNHDVIIATSPPLFVGYMAYRLSQKLNIPYVFEVRDLWPESAISTGVLKSPLIIKLSFWLEKLSYNHASLINVLTPAFKKILINDKKIPEDKIIYIPNAVDFSVAESSKNLDIPLIKDLRNRFDFLAVYIGAHGVANHLEQVLETAKLVKEEKIAILLIGDGMRKIELKEQAAKEKIANVIFIDSVPKRDVYAYISQVDVGISCLQKNNTFKSVYSNKTFDYMACSKPVVMAIDGISRELIEKAKCGLYAEPENAGEIASVLIRYKNDCDLHRRHGINGYAYVKKYFDRMNLANSYIEQINNKVFSV